MQRPDLSSETDEFVTIIGTSMAEISSAYGAQDLAARKFSIVHKTGRHRFTFIRDGKAETMFDGQQVIAATFARNAGA